MGRLGDEVVVLVDLPGGTPANVCMRVPAERGCQAVVGVDLPMLIEAMLSAGANREARNTHGETPSEYADRHGRPPGIRDLLK